MTAPRIVIAGMGDTGVLTAIALGNVGRITAITAKSEFVSGQELGQRLARPEKWADSYRIAFDRFRRLDKVAVKHGRVTAVRPQVRTVEVTGPDGTSHDEPYDILVIATGVTNGFWRQSTLEDGHNVDDNLRSMHYQIADSDTVAIVGGGASALSAAAQIAERWPQKTVDVYFPGQRGLPYHHDKVWRSVSRRLTQTGVQLHPGHRAIVPGGTTPRTLTSEPVEFSTGQPSAAAEAVLWALGTVEPNTDWLPADMRDGRGFVVVEPTLQVTGYDNIFAVGDVAATDPLRTSARNQGHALVARNIRALLAGKALATYRAPARRWGSVLGTLHDGQTIFTAAGRGISVTAWVADVLFQKVIAHRIIYKGVRRAKWPSTARASTLRARPVVLQAPRKG